MESIIDWTSTETLPLLNPRLNLSEQERIKGQLSAISFSEGHLWIATSGSTGEAKWSALSKRALLASAASINLHLQTTAKDKWLNPLPLFHTGGLGIYARAYLSKSQVISLTWNAEAFVALAQQHQATLASLVPAQVYDLVLKRLAAPSSMRAVIVGGGALSEALYQDAISLGWPLLPSYGLTEASSQVATAECVLQKSPGLKLLSHIQAKISPEGFICLKGPSLLTGYALLGSQHAIFNDPLVDGWFQTEDRGKLEDSSLTLLGREGDFIKIGGESVDLTMLTNLLEAIKLEQRSLIDCALIPCPDERLGHVIHLAAAGDNKEIAKIVDSYQQAVLPFAKIRCVHLVPQIPRTSLGKLQRAALSEMIG